MSWDHVVGADGYELLRSRKKNSNYVKVCDTTGRNHADTKFAKKSINYYKVRSYRTRNGERHYGAMSRVVTVQPQKPAVPKRLRLKQKRIQWNKVGGADGYVIYTSKKKTGGYKKLDTIKGKTRWGVQKIGGEGYRYVKIRAYISVGSRKHQSGFSKPLRL